MAETAIRNKPRALLVIYQRSKARVLRCKICHLGFSGQRVIERAKKHIRTHDHEIRINRRKK